MMISQVLGSMENLGFVGDTTGFEKHIFPKVSMMYHRFKAIRSDDDITMFPYLANLTDLKVCVGTLR